MNTFLEIIYKLWELKSGNSLVVCNKTYNLCYGRCISAFIINYEIIKFKRPWCVKNVNYTKLVKDLFKTSIGDDADIDT